jgi:hypothetical protein
MCTFGNQKLVSKVCEYIKRCHTFGRRAVNNRCRKVHTIQYPLNGSNAISLGLSRPVLTSVVLCSPDNFAISIVSLPSSVQYKCLPIQSTAMPSTLPMSACEVKYSCHSNATAAVVIATIVIALAPNTCLTVLTFLFHNVNKNISYHHSR